jgi:hypothetical protein
MRLSPLLLCVVGAIVLLQTLPEANAVSVPAEEALQPESHALLESENPGRRGANTNSNGNRNANTNANPNTRANRNANANANARQTCAQYAATLPGGRGICVDITDSCCWPAASDSKADRDFATKLYKAVKVIGGGNWAEYKRETAVLIPRPRMERWFVHNPKRTNEVRRPKTLTVLPHERLNLKSRLNKKRKLDAVRTEGMLAQQERVRVRTEQQTEEARVFVRTPSFERRRDQLIKDMRQEWNQEVQDKKDRSERLRQQELARQQQTNGNNQQQNQQANTNNQQL